MRNFIFILLITVAALLRPVLAGEIYTTEKTKIRDLLADPQAKAILEKYLPQNIKDDRFSLASSFSLRFIAAYDEKGEMTNENLDQMDLEFKSLARE
ncbi:hypothetical protein [Zhongshania aquimaris]|uniref:Uncharacterized protein n=1 Tax=Zhongshania aquimaris TaxID=2857107 RepID=A0ABS6VVW3_9GAMM|nr:hypothetical protein [Zhongshania aquimaris]MBW2942470.1 hypothetical protein [Zhongshania aquimaris]